MLEDVGEISEILGRSYGCPDGLDEADLDAELACLEDELASEEVDFASSTAVGEQDTYLPSMPAQPTASVFSQAEATAAMPQPATAAPAKAQAQQYNSLV